MLCYSIFAGTVAIIIISATAAQDYPNCSRQFECGDFRIGYPFSGAKRAANCGLPTLRLICGAIAIPMIGILGIPHKILRIDEPSRTLTLLRDGDGDILCYPPRNTTLDPGFFDFAPDTQFALLYYYCPPPDAGVRLPPSIGQFNCSSGSGGYFLPSEYLLGGIEDSVRTWLRSCGIMVRMPANRTELGMPANQTELGIRRPTAASADWLATVMYRGFGLRWTGDYEDACRNCKGSGGKCGFNETATRPFVCYCSDQAYASDCLSLTNASPPPEKALDKAEGRNRVLLKILLPIAAFVTLSVAAITFFYCIRNRASQNQNGKTSSPLLKPLEFIKMQRAKSAPFGGQGNVESPPSLQAFTFSEIKTATNDFSDDNLLGAGGFGPVYKCVFPGDEEMAVKRLSKSSTQGLLEFTNEVSLTARLQHVNLVRVVGFCTEKDEKMLVYEFMPNRSLDIHLFDPVKRLSLDWSTRIRIIEGVTQGLLYLQEYSNFTIIHRDIKASNVLLDDGMNPKISDFGMAKLFMKDLYEANTNKIVGTYGYVPPEYVKNGIYSIKYDVYSFGVLLLQIISSKRTQDYYGPNEDMHLLDHAYDSWRRGEGMEFCDPSLDDSSSECKLMTCLQVALLCVQEDPNDRPTMLEVAFALRTGALKMASPKKPAFSVRLEPVSPTTPKFRQEIWSCNVADISQVEPR
ncbi:unnamed protein product [Linum tenue]|uniref:non-specific serine/threonine protein kinase n=1 Tax=Linum tenue TaxID=586396 RepID=A0AAV0HUN4_9ROSI|nr:unnamed protein product [Linum tenue]